jgi:hypothetical protein
MREVFVVLFTYGSLRMKKIALVGATLALAMAAGSASAAGRGSEPVPTAGSFGISVGLTPATMNTTASDFLITGRYLITRDMAILAGFGFQSTDNGATANNKATNFGFMGGFRKYLKNEELAPFVGARLQYLSTKDYTTHADTSDFLIGAEVGAEYFFNRQFSVEGAAGAGYVSHDVKPVNATTSVKGSVFGTLMYSLSANFYF